MNEQNTKFWSNIQMELTRYARECMKPVKTGEIDLMAAIIVQAAIDWIDVDITNAPADKRQEMLAMQQDAGDWINGVGMEASCAMLDMDVEVIRKALNNIKDVRSVLKHVS